MKKSFKLFALLAFVMLSQISHATYCDSLHVNVSISASATVICSGTPVIFTAYDSIGTLPIYRWYKNGLPVGTNATTYTDSALNNNYSVWVTAINFNNCADTLLDPSNHISVTVKATPAAPAISLVSGTCQGTDSIGYTLNPSASQINWYVNGSLTDTLLVTSDTPAIVVPVTSAEPLYMAVKGNTLYVSMEGAYAVWDLPIDTVNAFVGSIVAGGNGSGNASNQFSAPASLTFDGQGNLYVCDPYNYRVQMFPAGSNSTTNGITVAGGNGPGNALNQFSLPGSVAVDTNGNIYVADVSNNRILKFPAGSTSATMGTIVAGGNGTGSALNQIYYAEAVYVDGAGNIYVSDGGNSRVLRFPPNSTSATMGTIVAGGNGYGNAANQLSVPFGIYTNASGYMFVTDRDNSRIQMFPPNSNVASNALTIAGGINSGSGILQLNNPLAPVVFDTSGSYMFIDDRSNQRVLRYYFKRFIKPASAGTYSATYTAPDGCVSAMSDSVNIYPSAVVTLSWDSLISENFPTGNAQIGLWCGANEAAIIPLKGGLPSGGFYSGGAVLNDTLNFMQWAVNDTDVVHYTYANTNGCSASASGIIINTACTGIEEPTTQAWPNIYPNPCNGSFTAYNNYNAGVIMQVHDLTGKLVLTKNLVTGNNEVFTTGLAAGVYAITFYGLSPETVKLVITR